MDSLSVSVDHPRKRFVRLLGPSNEQVYVTPSCYLLRIHLHTVINPLHCPNQQNCKCRVLYAVDKGLRGRNVLHQLLLILLRICSRSVYIDNVAMSLYGIIINAVTVKFCHALCPPFCPTRTHMLSPPFPSLQSGVAVAVNDAADASPPLQ